MLNKKVQTILDIRNVLFGCIHLSFIMFSCTGELYNLTILVSLSISNQNIRISNRISNKNVQQVFGLDYFLRKIQILRLKFLHCYIVKSLIQGR